MREAGAGPPHAAPLLRAWIEGRPLAARRRARSAALPAPLLAALPALQARLDALAVVAQEHASADGSVRYLLGLGDGAAVESVLLPREGLCVSTQAGCAVGCLFCSTGQAGLVRQLSAAEICAQVAMARRHGSVRKVVFMGMGEPSHNLPAVLPAITFLAREGGLGAKSLVFSTVGDARTFRRLEAHDTQPALALSLHTLDASLRARLLPRATRADPARLLELAAGYAERTGYPLQVQWTLLDEVNDGEAEAERLAALLRGRRAMVNYIPYNEVPGAPFRRPPIERMRGLARRLHASGVLAKLRRSAAQDVGGACGQLRAGAAP